MLTANSLRSIKITKMRRIKLTKAQDFVGGHG